MIAHVYLACLRADVFVLLYLPISGLAGLAMGFVTTLHVLTRRVAVLFIFRPAQLQQGTSYVFLFGACLSYKHTHKRVHAVAIFGQA